MIDDEIEDDPHAPTRVHFAVRNEPCRHGDGRHRGQNALHERLRIADLVDDGAHPEPILHELPQHHVIRGMNGKVLGREAEAQGRSDRS